ncbi:beta-ketoacyl-[acyl-carrier-protein] synthase family protein [Streptomyces sp. NPDC003035]|uniref:beta-ketoacyl-[acyl-carrier-protein] synthase family protein n=1 Tax=Streptomyces sp. NPDC003035 TaxID=3364676 RepID=UPI00369C80D7
MTRAVSVAITGIGLVTPAGVGTKPSWRRLLSASPTAGKDPRLAGLSIDISCRVHDFDTAADIAPTLTRRLDLSAQYALVAAQEAVRDAGHDCSVWDAGRVGVVLGSAAGGVQAYEHETERYLDRGQAAVTATFLPRYLPNMAVGHVAQILNAQGPSLHTSTACASGTTAIGLGVSLLRSGACDIVVAGGTEAFTTPVITSAFARMRALSKRVDDPSAASRPFDVDRDGFVMSEGAGVLVLERADQARRRGTPGYAHIVGYGASSDAHHPVAPHPEGRGVRAAILAALDDARARPREVDHVNAHGTSTPANDAVEGAVLAELFPHHPAVTAPKGVVGHMIGAAGAVEAAFTALSLAHGVIPPCANLDTPDPSLRVDTVRGSARHGDIGLALSNSFGFGGHNAVLAMRPAV